MEIWISDTSYSILKKSNTYIKYFGKIDVKKIYNEIGYKDINDIDKYDKYIINKEIKKWFLFYNKNKKFFRILYIVPKYKKSILKNLIKIIKKENLKYDKIYLYNKDTNTFDLIYEL